MKKERVHMLVESAMLLTLGVVLEVVSKMLIPEMPFGGQLTLASMLPLVLISYRHGVKWGVFSGVVYSILQMALGAKTVSAAFQPGYFGDEIMIVNAFVMVILDYLVAYTLLGLGGIFRNKIKKAGVSLMCGGIVALSCRYLAHVVSGYILFAGWAEWFFTQEGFPAWGAKLVESVSPGLLGLLYSIVYNGMYMLPEIVITSVAALLVARIPKIVIKKN
jgi:thiamine transporter